MRRLFTDDPLEDFLKQNADRFQMRPSDKVWQGISDNLKRRNRRIGWFTGFFLVAASLTGYLASQQQSAPDRAMGYQQNEPHSSDGVIAGSTARNTGDRSAAADGSSALLAAGPDDAPAGSSVTASPDPARVIPFRGARRGTATGATHAGGQGTGRPEHNAGADELDRMYTDASLAEPAVGLRAQAAQPSDAASKDLMARLMPQGRLSLQFFVTPTLSYRSLTENKDFTQDVPQANADPNTVALYNINDAVTHKPSIGLEMGVSAKYALARNLKIQGGVQFNVSRYMVQAFDNFAPQTATMAYNGGGSTQRSTPYSNLDGGGRKENLQNMYFQVSAPIGLEFRIAGNSHTQFGVTSTIQPTYVLSDRVYMLSTDYKTYAEVPWLIRRWNVNTALSTYVGYSTGKLAWQVGPQVRYQLMSSFVSAYPVKENLFDVGLRVGVSLHKGTH